MRLSRLDRQLRIDDWNQDVLEDATVGVVGDDDLLASLFIMSASALGINKLIVLAPSLNNNFVETAKKLNSRLNLTHVEGFFTHPVLNEIFKKCNLIIDLTSYALANKLLLQKGFMEKTPIIRGFCYEHGNEHGFKIFTYMRGREWQELEQVISFYNFANDHFDDTVLATIVIGIVLEEVKNILMGQEVSENLIAYRREKVKTPDKQLNIIVVGAGALGIFVGLGLACSGFRQITFMDPDEVEVTNLNRQVFFYNAIGKSKAKTLAKRLNTLFDAGSNARAEYFDSNTDIGDYDVVFDCVDNFETRIVLSEKCKNDGKILISGGTSADAGQVIVYNPTNGNATPAELLGLYDIVAKRGVETYRREKTACIYRPNPSVIMTNQIIAGFMVDSFRVLLSGHTPRNIYYNSISHTRF